MVEVAPRAPSDRAERELAVAQETRRRYLRLHWEPPRLSQLVLAASVAQAVQAPMEWMGAWAVTVPLAQRYLPLAGAVADWVRVLQIGQAVAGEEFLALA